MRRSIGNIHPAFFDNDSVFKKFRTIRDQKGVEISTPFFSITYSDGFLTGDDEDVLDDMHALINIRYGNRIEREEFKKRLDFEAVTRKWSVLNVGVCVLEDSPRSGWDGRINSIWLDSEKPGEVVDTYFQYWNYTSLLDVCSRIESISQKGRELILPNVIDALESAAGEDINILKKLI